MTIHPLRRLSLPCLRIGGDDIAEAASSGRPLRRRRGGFEVFDGVALDETLEGWNCDGQEYGGYADGDHHFNQGKAAGF